MNNEKRFWYDEKAALICDVEPAGIRKSTDRVCVMMPELSHASKLPKVTSQVSE
jgi:hypothetical protein